MSTHIVRQPCLWGIILIIVLFSGQIHSFDWKLYFQNNPEFKSKVKYGWPWAFADYMFSGIKSGRKSILQLPPSSNFDWKFYVDHNQLQCNDEVSALNHYQTEGFFKELPYCYSYTLVIMFHMYNLDLLDECINQLNHFMRINPENNYYIKINIPVASNISKFFNKKSNYEKLSGVSKNKHGCCNVCNEFDLVDTENSRYLQLLVHYINQALCIDSSRLEVIFSPNRGRDIGGFFLSLDRLFKQDIAYDYIVKIHSKTSPKGPPLWRQLNMSFLNIHINPILREYDCIYSNRIEFPDENVFLSKEKRDHVVNGKNVMCLLDYYKLPFHQFNFCGGNMFIVSKKMTEFFRSYNLHDLFYSLNDEASFANALDGKIEHAYERFFGYLIDHLGLKTFLLDYHPLPFPGDNAIAKDYNVSIDYDRDDVKKLIHENNIKVMALYSPIYYQKIESSENEPECWKPIKNSKQQIKRPRFDLGYYNILDQYTRQKQAFIASKYGIEAFCYQHFWGNGHSLLADGLEKIIEEGVPNMPFTLCWMNGDGMPYVNSEINYDSGSDDKEEHYAYLSKFFKHPLYIHQNNCPVFYVQHVDEHNKKLHEKLLYFQECAIKDGFSGLNIIPQNSQCLFYGLGAVNGEPLLKHMSYRLFEQFLQKIVIHTSTCADNDFKYIFLVSWNDWYMQSMFEPNDHDGYELLKIIQQYFV